MKSQRSTKQGTQLQALPIIENNAIKQNVANNKHDFIAIYGGNTMYNTKSTFKQNNNKLVQQLPAYDPNNSSKGVDAWNLNKNLKQYSETRQLRFFNATKKTKSNSDLQNSPYISNKNRNMDIKSYNKIKSNATIQTSIFKQAKTIATLKPQNLIPVPLSKKDRQALHPKHVSLDTSDYPEQSSKASFRKRKFQSKSKYQKQLVNIQTLQPYLRNGLKLSQTIPNTEINPLCIKTRRNRFIQIEKNNKSRQIVHKSQEVNEQQGDVSDLQNSLIQADSSPRKPKTSNKVLKQNKRKNKNIQKSIQKITKCFLSKVDNFLDQTCTSQISSSKIEVYTTTVQQPNSYTYNIDYKSSTIQQTDNCYDFQFEGQRQKNRSKTPYKRKKMYEQIL